MWKKSKSYGIREALWSLLLAVSLALSAAERTVKISQENPLLIFADVFEVIKKNDGSEIGEWRGNVRLKHADYLLGADRLQVFKEQMEGIASGNVKLENTLEGLTLTSDKLFYRDDFEYVEITGQPYLVKVDETGVTITARSERMEFFQHEERGRLIGEVEITQGELVVQCQEAVLYNQEDKIVLSGNPRLQQEDTYFAGQKMVFFMEEDRLQIEGDVYGELYPVEEGKD